MNDQERKLTREDENSVAQNPQITRRGFLRAARNVLVGGSVCSVVGWKYSEFERGWLKINRETFKMDGLPEAFEGLTITHLSDLHLNRWMTAARFEEVVDQANQVGSDLILVTGDFIDSQTDMGEIPLYTELLARLSAPMGRFAVLGNHDHWIDADLVRGMLEKSGFVNISNRTVSLELAGESIQICGLDSYMEGLQELPKVLSELPEDQPAILLVHEPDFADISADTGRFGLQLSGHSHGGQVYIPLLGPPITPDFGRKYPRGRYRIGEMELYTNRGIGMIEPYVRLNCRPEIAVLTLVSA